MPPMPAVDRYLSDLTTVLTMTLTSGLKLIINEISLPNLRNCAKKISPAYMYMPLN